MTKTLKWWTRASWILLAILALPWGLLWLSSYVEVLRGKWFDPLMEPWVYLLGFWVISEVARRIHQRTLVVRNLKVKAARARAQSVSRT